MCSYGTNRKLSTALALIGNPSILLLVRSEALFGERWTDPWADRGTLIVYQKLLRHSWQDTPRMPTLSLTTYASGESLDSIRHPHFLWGHESGESASFSVSILQMSKIDPVFYNYTLLVPSSFLWYFFLLTNLHRLARKWHPRLQICRRAKEQLPWGLERKTVFLGLASPFVFHFELSSSSMKYTIAEIQSFVQFFHVPCFECMQCSDSGFPKIKFDI